MMNELWLHSIDIAAMCFVLSKRLKLFSPEEALLCGLLHDIGSIPLILNAHNYDELSSNMEELAATLSSMKSELGGTILEKWLFPEQIVTAAREAELWQRDSANVDLCDLVIVAQLQSFSDNESQLGLPSADQTIAYRKLGLDQMPEERFEALLTDVAQQRSELKSLFSG